MSREPFWLDWYLYSRGAIEHVGERADASNKAKGKKKEKKRIKGKKK
jgi:hypothetical protein